MKKHSQRVSKCSLRTWLVGFIALATLLLITPRLRADDAGSITGTVQDPQGAIVAGASVSVVSEATNVRHATTTDPNGAYSFVDLPVGSYDVDVEAVGFKHYRRTGVVLDANRALAVNVSLVLGDRSETIVVTQSTVSADLVDTQLGEVISGRNVDAVPLNGRSFTDLLALQPGVAPMTTITGQSIQAAGASTFSPSGYLNPGTISINGQREYANGFTVNDADVVERFTMGAAVVPNLDSISEFRILTGDFDAEYGNYSGGRINVVTKSGSNQFHGSAFEFLRNTDLDARNFFSSSRGAFQQNQFGGTFGGAIVKDKVFFYMDYQGTRLKQGLDTGLIAVPSLADRAGNLADLESSLDPTLLENGSATQVPNVVNGQYWASQLSQQLGYQVNPNEPYYFFGCTSHDPVSGCALPNAMLPPSAWSGPAQQLLQFIPSPNRIDGTFDSSAENLVLGDDKAALRMDANTSFGILSSYYFLDNYTVNNPYPTQQGGANVPGFNALNLGRAQLFTLGDIKSFGSHLVNEFHFSFVRDTNNLGVPVGGVGPSLASQGFVTPSGAQSIVANRPHIQGIENTIFNSYTIGINITGLDQHDNTFELRDSFSRIFQSHALKFGGEFLYSQVNAYPDVQSNGTFTFAGTETGSDFVDFLLGVPSRFTQGDARAFYNRNKYGALFVEDSWRVRPNVTLNYGLRWDVIMPWYEKYNQIQTIVPGEQSVVFPGAPLGLVFPTDPGISRSLAPTRWNDFSPRLGIAYAPGKHAGVLGWLLGSPGKTSLRAGFGRFFTAVEGVSAGVMAGDAPYGQTYTSPGSPLFSNPYITAATGFDNGQRFPLQYPPLNASASHPNNTVNWANFLPITGLPGYDPRNVTPYSEQYTASIERQIGMRSLLTIAYVGSQSHHLLAAYEANPGNPALCLSLSQPSDVAPGTATCGPFQESNTFVSSSGQVIHGTRAPLGSNFGSVDLESTVAYSNYNALEVTLHHASRHLDLLAGYTYGKSLDNASSLSDQLIPGFPRLTYGLSAFDIRQNLVISYRYDLAVDRFFNSGNRILTGWAVSGITRFSTGFPVTFYNPTDNSLLGTEPNGVNAYTADLPYKLQGPLSLKSDPRGSPNLNYFNAPLFPANPPLGVIGNVPRRFFSGPGLQNWDMALLKDTHIKESISLQFRLEAFNAFNHTSFFGPNAVNATLGATTFGNVVNAASPRLVQAGLKLSF
jgi:Carboxypeptidase regulatory-like domain